MKYFSVSLLFFLFPIYLSAQTTSETQGNTLLPDINPQDIEIKGDYRIRFPGLQRQPILGFDPRQRVFQLNPNRKPFLETSDEIVASIPISPLEIPKSPVRDYPKKEIQTNWWILGGYGIKQSPEAELGFAHIAPSNYYVNGFFSHVSSPSLGFSVPSKFSEWKGSVAYTEILGKGYTWSTSISGNLDKNEIPLNAANTASTSVANLRVSTQVKKVINTWSYWSTQLNYSLFDHSLNGYAQNQKEHKAGLAIERFFTLATPQTGMGIGLDIQASNYQVLGNNQNYAILKGDFTYKNEVSSGNKLTLGATPYFSQDEGKAIFLIYPTAGLIWYDFLGATLRTGLYGEVYNGGRQLYFETSRFLQTDQALLNNRGVVIYANYELELMSRSSIYAGFDLKRFTQFGYINYVADLANIGQFNHVINYDQSQIVKLKAGYSFRFDVPELSFNAEAWILNHQLKGGGQIPYLERIGAKASFLWFIQKNWYFQPEIEFLAGREGANTSKAILLVHAKTRYAFNKNWAAYLKAINLTGNSYSYWSEFKELPMFITGGLNLTF